MNKKGQLGMIIVVILMIAFVGTMLYLMQTIRIGPEATAANICKQQEAGKYVTTNKLKNNMREVICDPPGEGKNNRVKYTYPADLKLTKGELKQNE